MLLEREEAVQELETLETANWLSIIRAEYREMPGLHLTTLQARRLWGLDAATCDAVLQALETAGFLTKTAQNGYVKADSSSR